MFDYKTLCNPVIKFCREHGCRNAYISFLSEVKASCLALAVANDQENKLTHVNKF